MKVEKRPIKRAAAFISRSTQAKSYALIDWTLFGLTI